MHQASRRLALVTKQTRPERDSNGARQAAMARPSDALPFAVRLTILQILQVADDTDIRAEILNDVASTFGAAQSRQTQAPQIDRRVDELRGVAEGLRSIAAQAIHRWAEPERST